MNDAATAAKTHLAHQVAHWTVEASRLRNFEDFAAPGAWSGLERYLGLSIRRHLTGVVERLMRDANVLNAALDASSSLGELESVRRQLLGFRQQYLRAETTLEALRLLALAGLRAATTPGEAEQMFKRNEDWMLRLGGTLWAA